MERSMAVPLGDRSAELCNNGLVGAAVLPRSAPVKLVAMDDATPNPLSVSQRIHCTLATMVPQLLHRSPTSQHRLPLQ